MAQNNTYYRAFLDYRKNTEIDKICKKDRKVLSKIEGAFEKFEVTKFQITIDESWVIEIEKGLEFIEKAIKEERQFIRTDGEIVPIEKVKKVSRDSVVHLARHSDMITHVPDNPNDTAIPDKIYMVEKLNDYAVYENRFIYMLLCYLRDFIALRIEKITDIRMTYICDFVLKRSQKSKKRNMEFDTHFYEHRKDNPYPIDNKSSASIIKRINDCAEIVNMLLNTPLMTEVSKSPMIKPPIVKTNVLKMNNNFKNALVLYDFIVNYSQDGYTSEEVVNNLVPIDDDKLDEFMELPILTNFLTYKFGNDIVEQLHKEYLNEEEIKKQKEEKELQEKIKRLRKKVLESGKGYEEYMLLLEKEIRMLETDSQNLVKAKLEIVELNKKIDVLNLKIEELEEKIIELQAEIERKIKEIADLHIYYKGEIARIIGEYEDKLKALEAHYEQVIAELKELHAQEIVKLTEEYEDKLKLLEAHYVQKIDNLKEEQKNEITKLQNEHSDEISNLNLKHQNELEEFKKQYEETLEKMIKESQEKVDLLSNELSSLQEKYNSLLSTSAKEKEELKNKVSVLEGEQASLVSDYQQKLKDLEQSYEDKLNSAKELHDKLISDNNIAHKNEISNLKSSYEDIIKTNKNEFDVKVDTLTLEAQQALFDRNLMAAELRAIRIQNGIVGVSEEYTEKERFAELEKEFLAFNAFFKAQWDMTKKAIKKQLLGVKVDKKMKNVKTLAQNASSHTKEEMNEAHVEDETKNNTLENNENIKEEKE